MKPDRRDLEWIVLIAVLFITGLVLSWERWGNPLVDCGREMNQPLRLAAGEMLYSDVRHIYGPLSPYINAFLIFLAGPSLEVLYADGLVTAVLIIALVYWLSRKIMAPAPAGLATLAVVWLCALKQSGNYLLPYSFAALHGCLFGLASLGFIVRCLERRFELTRAPDTRHYQMTLAGLMAGLAMLAKTEIGIAALLTGIAASVLVGYPSAKRCAAAGAPFILTAVVLVGGVYSFFVSRVGWDTLANDSYLLMANLPPELVYFNKRVLGIDRPLDSVLQIAGSAIKFILLGVVVASISLIAARRGRLKQAMELVTVTAGGKASVGQLWAASLLSLGLFLAISLGSRMQLDRGPFLAIPILIAGLLANSLNRFRNETGVPRKHVALMILFSVYSLANLARVMLRVRSGGAYSAYLLPGAIILFVYTVSYSFPSMLRDARAGRIARRIVLGSLMVWVLATAVIFSVRYQRDSTYPVSTSRGTIVTVPGWGEPFAEAVDFINRETVPGEPIAVMPEGTSLNFLTEHPNPLRDEILIPGILDRRGEEQAINRLVETDTRYVFVTNRPTPEFGAVIFGRDYYQRLWAWLNQNYEVCAVFGRGADPALEIGDKRFFIKVYRKKTES